MIGRRAQENIIVVLIILALIGVIVMSFDYGPRARMVPVPVAIFGLVLAVVQLVWQNLRSADELQVDLLEVLTKRGSAHAPAEKQEAPAPSGAQARARFKRETVAYGMVFLFLGIVWLTGPMPAVFIFTLGYFAASRQYPFVRALVYTSLFTGAVYAVFVYALEVQLYHGYLEPVIEYFR